MKRVFRVLALLFVASALAGCATQAAMRQKTPALDLKSALPAKAVAICIAYRWENAGGFGTMPVSLLMTDDGYVVFWQNETLGYILLFVDVKDTPDGSLMRYYKNFALVAGVCDEDVIDC